ncbi:ABC transporter permease subunit [Aquihabitans sp. G128]|uniref:ABC transporter permease subunit n=1 Tax=Aquihabitans sp. G128 TaxID=2849779 RepID=UPI001C248DA9|nr:ABC transporter permease subunit [Aquihabitans sp. G128]QXC60137.1 ABC transporter permease subunit [Aquihabitans sp. G128]
MTDAELVVRPPSRGLGGIDWAVVRVVLGRDLGAIVRSKALILPMLFLPVVLLVLLPTSIGIAANGKSLDIDRFVNMLPTALAEPILGYPQHERLVILVLGYLVAPLFLIVPLMVSAVTASDTFAGEKERKTLETLLHLPVRDRDLYVAKLLGGFVPATAVSWIGFVLFATIANAVCWPVMHRLFLPTWMWALVILWLAPAVSALGLGIMVRVSMRVNNTQEAQQLGGAVVLPLVILAVGQTTGLLLAGPLPTFLAGVGLWAVAGWLNIRGARSFTRDTMAARL